MWTSLPFDLLAKIFSLLSPDSLARARVACRHWHACANAYPLISLMPLLHHPPWFVALPTRSRVLSCYVHNPNINRWHALSLAFLPDPIRPVASIGCLFLLRFTNSTILQLAICNPFTRQVRNMPTLNITRTNPAAGVVVLGSTRQYSPFPQFRVYVAGGMSEPPQGGGATTYEPTLEMYDSTNDTWQIVSSMPMEFAVRLTVWTPNESVYCNGVLYWMTSARAYSVMGFAIGSNKWQELSVPFADRLEFATLARRNGRLTLVGGTCGGDACVWELDENGTWCLIEKMPNEFRLKLLVGRASWGSTKCVGCDGAICLYRDLGSGLVVWRQAGERGKWEWFWVEGCCFVSGKQVQNFSIKGLLIHPCLAPSSVLSTNR